MNKIMLIGNVGADPEVRYYEADQAVAQVRLATTERGYTLQNGTQVPDHTDWHNLVMYRRLAKVVEKYVHKGDKLYVEGRIRYRSYDDQRGVRKFVTEILVDNMEMLSPKAAANATGANAPESAPQPVQPRPGEKSDDEVLPF
ncbi:single-stranded DNA-binding protein [Prevotella sp. oral taxon 376]|uniref:single-stranded DNA-binding protein n=1 Tax=Prevotella sp. oral taxon 376 TaxID=712466 RepID=UPI000D1E0212|nr:single-stranded DNA-binding protein [Prevotella sp. oral taxon 376]PTL34831.1 single-stranded DNA-binding protein [Prevotella sp. oral taxon 376]